MKHNAPVRPEDFRVSRIDKALSFVAPRLALSRTEARLKMFRYEAAQLNRLRGHASFGNQTPDGIRGQVDRRQMMWDARDLEENTSFVKSLQSKIGEYCVGTLSYEARTGDIKADLEYEQYWRDWCKKKNCDYTERFTFNQKVMLALRSTIRDGDMLEIVVPDGEFGIKLQSIESDRIGNPYQTSWTKNHFAGITLGTKGEPVSYTVYERMDSGQYGSPQDFPASRVLHMLDPFRIDHYRGVTGYHTALNTLRDISEIVGYEKTGVKWASSVAGVIINETGTPENGDYFNQATNDANAPAESVMKVEAGEMRYLRQGNDMKQFTSSRPSAAWQGFLQYLIRDTALGLDMPYGFVYDASGLGGPVARLQSEQAKRAFQRIQTFVLEPYYLDPVKELVLAMGISLGKIRPTQFWNRGKWLYPAHPTVDVGRESQANLNENRQGLRSASRILGEQGERWREEQEQIAIEARNILDLAEKYNVPVPMIQTLDARGRQDAETSNIQAGRDAASEPDAPPAE